MKIELTDRELQLIRCALASSGDRWLPHVQPEVDALYTKIVTAQTAAGAQVPEPGPGLQIDTRSGEVILSMPPATSFQVRICNEHGQPTGEVLTYDKDSGYTGVYRQRITAGCIFCGQPVDPGTRCPCCG